MKICFPRLLRRVVRGGIFGAWLMLLAGAGSAVELVDDRGVIVEIPDPPSRVAAVSTFGADLVTALGGLPAAVTRFGAEPVPAFLDPRLHEVTNIGARGQVNLELLSQIDPDLILAVRRYTESQAGQLQAIAPYVALDLVTLEDSFRAVAVAGRALGRDAEARRLNEDFEALLSRFRGRATGGLTGALLVSTAETPYIYYDHFLTARLMTELGVDNIGGANPAGDRRLPLGYRISLEQLLAADPDVIFLFASNKRRAFTHNPIWPHLSAVKSGRVYEVGPHWKEGAGPQARELILKEMAHLLYPALFSKPTLPESIRSRPYR